MTTPHSFAFKRRQDLFPEERKEIYRGLSRDFSSDSGDVFCLCKAFMHSTVLSQPPLLVFPKSFLRRLQRRDGPPTYQERHDIDKDRKEDIEKRMDILGSPENDAVDVFLPKAVEYYEWLLNPDLPPHPAPASQLLSEHRCTGSTLTQATLNKEFPHLPDAAWELKVRYAKR